MPCVKEFTLPLMSKIEHNAMDSESAPVGAKSALACPQPVVAVVDVGYVGSRLVEAFAEVYLLIAFDTSKQSVEQNARSFNGLSVAVDMLRM